MASSFPYRFQCTECESHCVKLHTKAGVSGVSNGTPAKPFKCRTCDSGLDNVWDKLERETVNRTQYKSRKYP